MATKLYDVKSNLQAQGATVISGKSADLVGDNIEAFKKLLTSPEIRDRVKELFPKAFADGELQMDALLQDMGKYAENVEDTEHYPISWRGKAKALQHAQRMTTATLRPCIEESVGKDGTKGKFDSQNLYIEGDNLEVLKVLERSYAGQIKMIYIDPPYNTGNDFIYNDKYADGIQTYLEYTGQKDDKGKEKSTKIETSGASHSNWLSMMYPRLEYAKRLLSDDGVIYISIGQNEIHNLISLCNSVFSESNHVSTLTRVMKSGGNKGEYFSPNVEYVCVYCKNINQLKPFREQLSDDIINSYNHIETEGERKGEKFSISGLCRPGLDIRPNQRYWVQCPDGTFVIPRGITFPARIADGEKVMPREQDSCWRWSNERYLEERRKGNIYFAPNRNARALVDVKGNTAKWNVYIKTYLNDRLKEGKVPSDLIEQWENRISSVELRELNIPFSFAKPTGLVSYLISLVNDNYEGVILDFFSGSATTAHAIMKLNNADNGNRKYIMVQLPELCDEKSEAYEDFKNIAEIGKERIRRAGKEIHNKNPAVDVGFKVFKLDSSNLKKWNDSPAKSAEEVANRLLGAQDMMVAGRTKLDIVYEYMLKYGLPLAWDVECKKVAGKDVYIVAGGALMVCLDHNLDKAWAEELVKLKEMLDPVEWRVLVADESFGIYNDKEKKERDTNSRNIFHTLCNAGLIPANFIIA